MKSLFYRNRKGDCLLEHQLIIIKSYLKTYDISKRFKVLTANDLYFDWLIDFEKILFMYEAYIRSSKLF